VNSGEVIDAREPETEELVRPAVCLEHVQCQGGVVVDGVDDHFHEMYPQGLNFGFIVHEDVHGESNELWDVVINMATHVEHDDLSQLAAADAINAANLVVLEDRSDHVDDGIEVLPVLDQSWGTVVDEVLERGKHVYAWSANYRG